MLNLNQDPIINNKKLEGDDYIKKLDELMLSIPEGVRLKIAYNPLIMLTVVFNISNDLVSMLADNKISETKKHSRSIRDLVSKHNTAYFRSLPFEVAESIKEFASKCKSMFEMDLQKYYFSYTRSILNEPSFKLGNDASYIFAWAYIIKDLNSLVLEFDKESFDIIQSYASKMKVMYTANEDQFCIYMNQVVDDMLKTVNLPMQYDNLNISTAKQIFRNYIHSIEYTDENGIDYANQ